MEKLVLHLKTFRKELHPRGIWCGGQGVGSRKVQTSRYKVSTQRGVSGTGGLWLTLLAGVQESWESKCEKFSPQRTFSPFFLTLYYLCEKMDASRAHLAIIPQHTERKRAVRLNLIQAFVTSLKFPLHRSLLWNTCFSTWFPNWKQFREDFRFHEKRWNKWKYCPAFVLQQVPW